VTGTAGGGLCGTQVIFAERPTSDNVKAMIYGHLHKLAIENWRGVQFIGVPSTAYNFADSEPIGGVEAVITGKGATLTLRATGGDTPKNGQMEHPTWRG